MSIKNQQLLLEYSDSNLSTYLKIHLNTVLKIKRFTNKNNIAIIIEDIHNSWLYCFTNPFELETCFASASSAIIHTADDAKAKHVSQVQKD